MEAIMDFGFRVAGVGRSAAKETPEFRSYLAPTPATLFPIYCCNRRDFILRTILAFSAHRFFTLEF